MEKLKTPLAIINFKAFGCAVGKNAVAMAKVCEKVSKEFSVCVAVALQPADILAVSSAVSIPIFAQHIDAVPQGAFTGSIFADSILNAGAIGSLVNHSEKPLDIALIKKTILRLKDLGLVSVACAGTSEMAAEISKLSPDFVAIEPPELIGGDVSVSQAKPEVITTTTERVKRMPVLCGAGIKTKTDVQKAVALGAKGILVGSGVCLAKNPSIALRELLQGFG